MKSVHNALKKNQSLFSIGPILVHLFIIGIVLGIYFSLKKNDLFPLWIDDIYIFVKLFIAIDIIIASASSILAPILGLSIGLLSLFASQVYSIFLLSSADAWQLIVISAIAAIISIIVKL